MSIVYLNGRYLPPEQATVSVLDRGFIFGDGIYEVIPVYGGRLFRLTEHLERLQHSLTGIRLHNPLSAEQWQQMLEELVRQNGGGDLSVYLQVTRGPAKRDHAFPAHTTPTVFAMANPLLPPDPASLREGVHAVTLDDIRWQYCHIKAITLLPNVLLRQQAIDMGAAEAILIRGGLATEGAASNLFIVQQGVILTPPKGNLLLPGITRDLVVELALQHGLPCREQEITTQALHDADEIWLTSSSKEIMPVTRLDQRPVGNGEPGPVWQRIQALYQAYKTELRRA